jgi:hypothetical protein
MNRRRDSHLLPTSTAPIQKDNVYMVAIKV